MYYIGIDPSYISIKNGICVLDNNKKILFLETLPVLKRKEYEIEYIRDLLSIINKFINKNLKQFIKDSIIGIENQFFRKNVNTLLKLSLSRTLWLISFMHKKVVSNHLVLVYPSQWQKYRTTINSNDDLNSAYGIASYIYEIYKDKR